MKTLVTREGLARLLNVSTRTLDRWRAMGVPLGEVRAYADAAPRFDPEKAQQALMDGLNRRLRKPVARKVTTQAIPARTPTAPVSQSHSEKQQRGADMPRHPSPQTGYNEGDNGIATQLSP